MDYSNDGNAAKPDDQSAIMPKTEALDYDLPVENMIPKPVGDDVASSSGSNVRSSLLAMGFSPSLVDRAIEENGDGDVDLLLETLFAYPALNRSDSSDSLDSLFGDEKDPVSAAHRGTVLRIKEELDTCEVRDEKKESLLAMDFSLDEVELAMRKIGKDAPVTELVDFILAARIAGSFEREDAKEIDQECVTEVLFGTMDKTLRLSEMGFSENDISNAIEKYGSETPLEALAESIVFNKNPNIYIKREEEYFPTPRLNSLSARSSCSPMGSTMHDVHSTGHIFDPLAVKREEPSPEAHYKSTRTEFLQKFKGKRPQTEYINNNNNRTDNNNNDTNSLKKPKQEYEEGLLEWEETNFRHSPLFTGSNTSKRRVPDHKTRIMMENNIAATPRMAMPNSCRSLDSMVAKPPYFFYGTIMNLSHDTWVKISQFLYAVEPEFVNTQYFSALNRREGYLHNLPTVKRSHVLPKPPMTIQEVMPQTSKWWPSWDTRKHINNINTEMDGVSQAREKIERIISDSRGLLTAERQRDIIRQCQTLNLVWVGRNRLAPIETETIENILGYPTNHTRTAGSTLANRLQLLKNSFQTDTLAYHLSTLKSLYPEGLRMLSIYSGIGGAEVALHRLGVQLKVVVAVEPCETKRGILKDWWESSGQRGELVQMEDVQKLASNRIEILVKKYGGFDVIVCQNPCTYDLKSSVVVDSDSAAGLDFSMFYEFVRVVQRIRSRMDRN
ncbi:unnamed protein product [Cuscuta epithymum]|uniref:SAM-dependent MTase DRM-type domain-containing protein n=1 Tax=Cuscuta epithymum TaxID=186058 RepID=A0AAV0E9D2_9ASTE|nr:unnamed protein product [Cuscuta epithymum]